MKFFVIENKNQRIELNKHFPGWKKNNSVDPRTGTGIALLKYFKDDLEKRVEKDPELF